MSFIKKLFSWFHKEEIISKADLPSTEPSMLKHDNPYRMKEINKARIQKISDTKLDMSSTPRSIKKYIESNLEKIKQIINTKPTPIPVFFNNDKQAENLPANYLQVYNIEGKNTDLGFETDGIFIHPEDEPVERIFYNEIQKISFIPFSGYKNSYVIFAFESKFGFRVFIYLEKKYKTVIKSVIDQGKENQSSNCSVY